MSTPAETVRVRFCPSPTGIPHVGLIRTALFNWAFARHNDGAMVFRIEDTDLARDTEDSYRALLDALRWLGLDWDEGPEVGGRFGPYRQSERREIYTDVIERLVAGGEVYESFSTNEEVAARHRAAGRDPKLGYDNADRELSDARKAAFRAEGRTPVLRLRMPDEDISFTDLVRGEITFQAGSVPDPVLVRGTGEPLYTLVNPADDALMKITHVLRGEDLLPSTPRQIALYQALRRVGLTDTVPRFGHLPLVMGEGNRKLSKRDPESNLFLYRERGFLPEGLLNYLALLGWAIAEDRDVFTPAELVEAFDVTKVSVNPARFDLRKAEAINATHLRALAPEDFVARAVPYLQHAGLLGEHVSEQELAVLRAAAPEVQERCVVLSDSVGLLYFLLVSDEEFTPEPESVAKGFKAGSAAILDATIDALEDAPEWTAEVLEHRLKSALVDGLGMKPRQAFTPVRVAVTGRTVSPPLYQSMEWLGRQRCLDRLHAARELAPTE